AGRWDYIFSIIRKFRKHHEFLLPDRALVTMNTHLMRSYSKLLIQISHRRGVHAIGGMAAQIPIKNNPELNETALEKVRADKEREVGDGHDGTWVAHPGLVAVAKEVFDKKMPQPNQISRKVKEYHIGTEDLLQVPEGDITEDGLRANINIGIRYLEAWLRGSGCVPIYNLMEDAATSEISRSQVWQWVNFPNARLNDGREINAELFRELVTQELKKIKELMGEEQFNSGKFELAARLFDGLVTRPEFTDFLTLTAYEYLD
ncbi:MAG: malate synthase A, partial [Calditrichia bacterium]